MSSHGDFRLGNTVFAQGDEVRLLGVLDWEMATAGDPLADLGYLLATWHDPGDPLNPMRELSVITSRPGFCDRTQLREHYESVSGRAADGIRWYEVLALGSVRSFSRRAIAATETVPPMTPTSRPSMRVCRCSQSRRLSSPWAVAMTSEPTHMLRARSMIAVWEIGEGPCVLLVHGFPDHPIGLLDLAHRIAANGYRCLLPALPGYRPSAPAPDDNYSSAAVGSDLLAVLDELAVERAAYVGHDWGAELGYPLLAAHPERFCSMVALATPHPAGYQIRRKVFGELRTAWYAMFLAYMSGAAEVARNPTWLTALVQSWSPGLRWEAWPEIVEKMQEPGVMEAVCAYYRANLDARTGEPVVEVPTTIVHGGQDGCIGPAAYRGFEQFFPAGLELVFVPQAGHWPHLDEPELTTTVIVRALGETLG